MLRFIGIDAYALLKGYGITDSGQENVSLNVDEAQYFCFMQCVKDELPTDDAVMRIINIKNIQSFSPPCFAAMCSHNGREFLDRFIRYKRLVCPLDFNLSLNALSITLSIGTLSGVPLPHFLEELEVAFIIYLLREATGSKIIPSSIRMSHKITSESLTDFLGCNIEEGSSTYIEFVASDLHLPFLTYNDNMWNCLRPGLEQQLLNTPCHDEFISNVRQTIVRQLTGSECSINIVASQLCVSVRTLQRQLAKSQITFNDLVAEIRHELAVVYLSNPEITVADISYLLGFKEYNSFLRAFRKWEGKSVTEFRREVSRRNKVG